ILPRLLIAAVLINLSIYLVALAVDITNVVGNGVEALIEGPFKNAGAFKLHIGGAAGDVGMGALLGSAGLIWKLSLAPALLEFLAFVVVLPAFLTFIAILVTVILRRGLILFLILISPVAFALYCLPNTEQYFRKWWDLLLRTLIVYPIIAAAFAIGNVLSVTMSSTSSGLIDGTLAQLLGIIALFVPLLLIPYSFRLAGGFLGRAHDAVTSVRDRAHKATEGRRQRAQSHLTRASIQGRQNWYSTLQDSASRGGAFRRRGLGGLARAVGGYNIEARSSAANAEIGKEFNDIIATGKDDEIGGLSVDKRYAQSRTTSDGRKQFKSLGGAWINEADVDAGHRRWGGNAYAMQASLAYEMRKADTEQDVQRIASDYHNVAQANGLTDQQAAGAWIGAAFQNQDKHLQFKYTNWQTGQMDADQRESFMSEIYEKRGSYNMAQMHAGTIGQVIQANRDAQAVIANSPTGLTGQARQDEIDQAKRMQGQAASIAESFVSRWGGGSGIGGEGAELAATMQQQAAAAAAVQQQVAQGPATGTQQAGPQIPASVARGAVNLGQPRAAGGLGPTVQTNTPGAAHVAERVRQLAVETGVYQTLDPSSDTRPSQGPPPISRQN
ncbi:MAG TPA: hypothetical protein VN778_04885, partial [Verrucomicrobiae bacterium]|nr:hypothetical protein [Verrucomicrobiae bacterium]